MRQLLFRSTAFVALAIGCAQPAMAQAQLNANGRLEQGDSTLESGEFYDSFTFEAEVGQAIDISATSAEFDTYLIVRGPGDARFENDDCAEGSTNACIRETASASGTWRVLVTSFEPGENGRYALRGGASGQAGTGGTSTSSTSTSTGSRQQRGTLAAGDARLNSGEYQDAFTIEGRAGQRVTIDLASSAFDTYLMLRGPDGSSFDNDDAEGGSGTNSRLEVTLPANGSYRLIVTSYEPGETGAYTLSSSGPAILAASAAGGSAVGSAEGQALRIGQPTQGTLADGDPTLDSGEYFDVYTLTADPGTPLVVEMQSTQLDTYLAAFGSGGFELSNDDDAQAGGTNSRLALTMPDSGSITIAATSYAGGETGRYTLTARAARGAATVSTSGAARLAPGQSVAGTLAASDPRGDGSVTDAFLIEGEAGQPLRLALTSDAFDPLLRLTGPDGFVAENDDDPAGGTLNSLIDTVLPASGTYRVEVASYAANGLGAYRLSSGVGSGTTAPAPVAGGQIALGQQLSGTLADGDDTLTSGEFMDVYRFRGEAGQRVTFDMASDQFDTYLSLLFPGGGQEENDDRAGGEGTDSRLIVTLPETGEYRLVATSYQPGESGSYAISMIEGGAVEANADPRRGTSRVFALSVGVADYERIGGLDLTDQDALKLTQTLQATGMLADESVTLVNADATRANFLAAIEQISASIGPDDLFLLFFSGHGGKEQVESFIERDGISETIEMFDAAITDHELEQMLEPIRARTLLVLDSCYSGGFDDVINERVGRMGVFSSDSDVTSLVASKFEAGGYISHILQQAMEGRADANADQAITAGELSEYMRTSFYRITLDEPLETTVTGTRGQSASGYQHIVVNRGGDGMPYEEVLVNLAPAQVSAATGVVLAAAQ